MIKLPLGTYCIVKNPIVRDENGNIVYDDLGENEVRFGEQEIRLSS